MSARPHTSKIVQWISTGIYIGICVVVGVTLVWTGFSYSRLPCHVRSLGSWRPEPTDFAGYRVRWAFKLHTPEDAGPFAACLQAAGYRVTRFSGQGHQGYLAIRGATYISNSDGSGFVSPASFYVW